MGNQRIFSRLEIEEKEKVGRKIVMFQCVQDKKVIDGLSQHIFMFFCGAAQKVHGFYSHDYIVLIEITNRSTCRHREEMLVLKRLRTPNAIRRKQQNYL